MVALMHSVVVGVAVLVVLHVVSGPGVDVGLVVLLKLVKSVKRVVEESDVVGIRVEDVEVGTMSVELEAVRVVEVVLGNSGVELVDEMVVGMTVSDVEFQ